MLQNMRKIAKRFTQYDTLKILNAYNYLHNTTGLHFVNNVAYWKLNGKKYDSRIGD